jgi:hypothetical protein
MAKERKKNLCVQAISCHILHRAKYQDIVWCDVINMDAYHLLLGRPWQFDRWVIHNGQNNTYNFLHKGIKITLLSLLRHKLNVGRIGWASHGADQCEQI